MGLVIYFTYTPGILEHLKMKRMPGLVLALAVVFLRIFFFAEKIRFLTDKSISRKASVRVALTWDFASAITPSTIGGAPVATYAMTREGVDLGRSSAVVLYGVLLDQLWYVLAVAVLVISGFYFDVIPDEAGVVGVVSMALIYVGLLFYGALLSYGLLVNPGSIKRLLRFIFKLPFLRDYTDSVMGVADNLENHSYQLKKKPASFMVKAFLLSTMSWLCRVAFPVIVVLSLLPADEILLILRSLAMNLAFLIIPTPGGSGGVEGLFVLFIGPLIDRPGFIGLAVFLWRILTYYVSIAIGIFAMIWYVNDTYKQYERTGNK